MGGAALRAYTRLVSLCRVLPALLALSACADGGGVCDVEEVTYHVDARLYLPDAAWSDEGERKASAPGARGAALAAAEDTTTAVGGEDGSLPSAEREARLLVAVHEDESFVACHDGQVTSQIPGRTLLTLSRPLSETFSLDVAASHFAGLGPSLMLLEVRLDENGNGQCDVGELSGFAALPAGEDVAVRLALRESGCPARL